jgi:hypothetical protein
MNPIKRISKKVWIILLIGLVIEVLLDPLSSILRSSENIQARVGTPNARAKWDAKKVNHYKFDIRGSVPLQCSFNGNIEVKDGEVIGIGSRSDTGINLLSQGGPNAPFLCDYRNYTVSQFFDEIEHSLQFVSQISFDAKYGFISSVRFGNPGGWGLLSPRIFDCCSAFTIENFQVLDG